MMLQKERKAEIVAEFGLKEDDTGSADVQVALLTERISQLTEHLKRNSHDYHSLRGLFKLTGRRRRFLAYLNRREPGRYTSLATRLGLRK
ncbi:MAG: 30S ribosomal protein S15 [Dehalococcoidia bacterium]|nr:30S ribosomal protein S15 [Chloroflexota bacterium]MCK4221967.1 30S ribosomal protein S15 [Dehalococcoidia bacterium]MCK4262701.1 30S ribosomal protein S15 [Dehalococcoidia bacterium]